MVHTWHLDEEALVLFKPDITLNPRHTNHEPEGGHQKKEAPEGHCHLIPGLCN